MNIQFESEVEVPIRVTPYSRSGAARDMEENLRLASECERDLANAMNQFTRKFWKGRIEFYLEAAIRNERLMNAPAYRR